MLLRDGCRQRGSRQSSPTHRTNGLRALSGRRKRLLLHSPVSLEQAALERVSSSRAAWCSWQHTQAGDETKSPCQTRAALALPSYGRLPSLPVRGEFCLMSPGGT